MHTLTFEEYFRKKSERSEYTINRQMGVVPRDDNPAHPEDDRRQAVHNAAWKHVVAGNLKKAHAAAYEVAKDQAIRDHHSPVAAHEIAERKARNAVKASIAAHTKKR
jgi:hypothetical protein